MAVARFGDIEWTNPPATDELPEDLKVIARQIKRKGLFAGEEGFYLSHVTMPAGHVAAPHSHSHSELFVLIDGSMELRTDDTATTLRPNDAVAIPAEQTYGFTIGPDGVAFLLVRSGRATHTLADS